MVEKEKKISKTLKQVLLANIKDYEWPINSIERGKEFEIGQQFLITGRDENGIDKVELLDENGDCKKEFKPDRGSVDIAITEATTLKIYFKYDEGKYEALFSFFYFCDDPALFQYQVRDFKPADNHSDSGHETTYKKLLLQQRSFEDGSMGHGGP